MQAHLPHIVEWTTDLHGPAVGCSNSISKIGKVLASDRQGGAGQDRRGVFAEDQAAKNLGRLNGSRVQGTPGIVTTILLDPVGVIGTLNP